MKTSRYNSAVYFAGLLLLIGGFAGILFIGAVCISPREVLTALFCGEVNSPYARTIVLETRLPMATAAVCCGASLSVAGLIMQTLFQNPLAGPSVLGISSGASFGVAVFMLGIGGMGGIALGTWQPLASTVAALIGGMATILILFLFSSILKTAVTLLIVGLMISYICSSGISLLNYFSPADEIRNFLVWGLGSFSGLRLSSAAWLAALTILSLIPSIFFIKPLNALLLGERYVESVGYSMKRMRGVLLVSTGLMVAVPTAFCGPIGFIGLIVPHLCRLIFKSSNHQILLPSCMLYGGVTGLLCGFIGVLPSAHFGVLPINVITPIIGVPVILYLLINRNRLPYFS